MSEDRCDTQEACIDLDKQNFKEELRGLTKAERVLIIEEYKKKAQDYGVGMKEFSEFMKWFDELED